ncbi:MAG TPA: BON domain-containing protein [Pyrinomonadaceae bacterium]|nr:BON domain-containing protein [Pyrinomonadaceae bacterium]
MRYRILGFIAVSLLALAFAGCGYETTNTNNANANANAAANTNANANTAVANANTNTRRAPTREEYDREKDRYQREAKESGRKVGTGLNDGWLWVKTKFELAAADDLRDSTINVDVDNEVVTLSGTVASAAQKTKAVQVAKAVEGVKSVKDTLKVAPTNSNAASRNTNK